MNIDIICVGKIKEKYLLDAISEYKKRLSRYCNLNILEVADEKTDENASEALNDKIKMIEAERILKYIKKGAHVITLEINGKMMSSTELADKIQDIGTYGVNDIQFVIGGSLGLHNIVISEANTHLSFSKMTFPHQLMRVILLEQIYRSYRIINNEPYHK
ncbi:MAG: 23S rRNA (pseudouridine(1915)-N(3))-methyltransferase RlmH [Lachnospiraceae bacterium]|nr:23S rRNA (pseudouridine(1915)-N(3))-methyltransferase RlmH [Lachnospiraceae bacterium]